jgi:shikimate kinase
MGSGKTSLGKLLARKLKFDFLDTDLLIEEQEKSSIQEIFNSRGESYFRELENKLLVKI